MRVMLIDTLNCGNDNREKIVWRGNLDVVPRVGDDITYPRAPCEITVARIVWKFARKGKPTVKIYAD